MTRLFHGFTVLAGSCAMTLIIGCGGSSSPKVTCDGGACGDAKKDTSGDGGRAETALTPDGRTTIPDGQTVTPDGPTVTPDGPTVTSDTPAVTPDSPAVTPDARAVTPDSPAVTPDAPAVTPDGPTVTPDTRPTDVPVQTDTRPDTAPGDTGNLDAGSDAPAPQLDAPADTAPDAPATDAADAGAGEVGDGGCEGALCQNFEGDNPDAGLPSSLTPVNGTNAWSLVVDGSNTVLEGTAGGTSVYVTAGVASWTDQTIQVKVRFTAAASNNNQVRICGRSSSDLATAYCLYISTSATANTGVVSLNRRGGGVGGGTIGTGSTGLDIALDAWHTYTLSISGSTTVTVSAHMDGNTTAVASATDATAGRILQGIVALGVRDVTAQFDDLVVTTP